MIGGLQKTPSGTMIVANWLRMSMSILASRIASGGPLGYDEPEPVDRLEGNPVKPKEQSRAVSETTPPPPCSTLNAKERQINEDYEWCLHDPEVRKQYGGKVVVAHRKRILGSGKNHLEAWRSATRNAECPGKDRVAVVFVPDASV
jgi:hypothetical protein